MEHVKFNETKYELVGAGSGLNDQGGKIVFLKGDALFDAVFADVKSPQGITVLGADGNIIQARTDLVFAGSLEQVENYIIGAVQVQIGTNAESGELLYETQNITETVLIASFRQPDIREQLAATNAKLEYMAMMSGIEMEV